MHSYFSGLTHWGRDKMDAILQTIFSNAFSWMKMLQLQLKFHWSLFPRVQLTIFQQWLRLGAVQATSHYMNQWWSVHRRIYASLGLNELKQKKCNSIVNGLELKLFCIKNSLMHHNLNGPRTKSPWFWDVIFKRIFLIENDGNFDSCATKTYKAVV